MSTSEKNQLMLKYSGKTGHITLADFSRIICKFIFVQGVLYIGVCVYAFWSYDNYVVNCLGTKVSIGKYHSIYERAPCMVGGSECMAVQ